MDAIEELRRASQESAYLYILRCWLKKRNPAVAKASDILCEAARSDRTIFWCGNGGSYSIAEHLSAELLGKFGKQIRKPIKSVVLGSEKAFLTAWSNDVGYNHVFARHLEALAQPGDVLVCLTTSGKSPNVCYAAWWAFQNGVTVITITSEKIPCTGELEALSRADLPGYSDVVIKLGRDTAEAQELSLIAGHILCEAMEEVVKQSKSLKV